MAAIFTVPAIFKAIDKISAPVRKMQKSVKRFGMSSRASLQRTSMAFNRLNKKISSVGKRIKQTVGGIGLAFGAMALVGVIGGAINVFADFEQANAGLASVMSSATEPQLKMLQKEALRLGATTAKTSTEVVGLQEAFARLGFGANDIKNMTQATIAGSIAMRAELADTADLVGAVIKTFDNLASKDSGLINDQMVSSTQRSALSFEKLQTALPNVAGAANTAKIPFNVLLALLGKLSDAGIDASSSSTALRNIILQSAKQGKGYKEILADIAKNEDKLTYSMNKFGVRGAIPGIILSDKLNETMSLSIDILKDKDAATIAAAKQLNTLNGRLTILGSAWEGWILSVDNGNGSISSFLKTTVEVATEFLSMATGTAKLATELNENELRVRSLALKLKSFLGILKVIGIAYLGLIVVQKGLNIAVLAYQGIIKIGHFFKFVRVFIMLAKSKGLATAAQKMLNASVLLNPYVLMGAAIAVAVGFLYKMITAQTTSQKLNEDIANRQREIATKEIVALDKSFAAIKKTLPKSKERLLLVQQLSAAYPSVNAAMEKEITNTNNLTKSYQFLREQIIKTAKARAIQEQIGVQANKMVNFELKLQQLGIDSSDFIRDFKKALVIKQQAKISGGVIDYALTAKKQNDKLLKKYGVDEGLIGNMDFLKSADVFLQTKKSMDDLIKLNETLSGNTPVEFGASNAINPNLNAFSGNAPIMNSTQQVPPSAQNYKNKLDVYINNRAGGTESYVEGTGMNVETTGY